MRHAVKTLVGELRRTGQSMASLTLSLGGEYFYSLMLLATRDLLSGLPLVTSLIPVMASVRGGVYSSIGSRVSTLLHLGYELGGLGGDFARRLHRSVYLVLLLLGVYVALLTGLLHPDISLPQAIYAALASLSLAHLAMFPLVLLMARVVFSRGLNPDNIMAPLITLLGDLWTVPTLLLVVLVLARWGWVPAILLMAVLLSLNLAAAAIGLSKKGGPRVERQVVGQLGASMLVAIAMEVLAGLLLSLGFHRLASHPGLLASLPIMMQAGGAIASISGSRISTFLHLGSYPPRLLPTPMLVVEYARGLVLAAYSYALAALVGWAGSRTMGLQVTLTGLLPQVLAIGMAVALAAPLAAHVVGVLVFRRGWDPDNISIPLLTSLVDLLVIALAVGMD